MRVFWLLALAVWSEPGPAAAQSPPQGSPGVAAAQHSAEPAELPAPYNGWAERPFALDANLGVAAPLGNLGVSLEYAPVGWVSLAAGVGTNLEGPQLAALLRLRFTPNKPSSLFAGGGYSRGPHAQSLATRYGTLSLAEGFAESQGDRPKTPSRSWARADWANFELGGETRPKSGFDGRGFFGVAVLLNPRDNQVRQRSASNPPPPLDVVPFVLYFGTALGFSL